MMAYGRGEVIFVLALLGYLPLGCCRTERISYLEKENLGLRAQVAKDRAVAEYDLQAKCSRDATAWFNDNWSGKDKKTIILLTHTNHLQKSSQDNYSRGGNGNWVNDMTLWDVYENKNYGQYTETSTSHPNQSPEFTYRVLACELFGKAKGCETMDDFTDLVWAYLNN
jgi:hypothetical protein